MQDPDRDETAPDPAEETEAPEPKGTSEHPLTTPTVKPIPKPSLLDAPPREPWRSDEPVTRMESKPEEDLSDLFVPESDAKPSGAQPAGAPPAERAPQADKQTSPPWSSTPPVERSYPQAVPPSPPATSMPSLPPEPAKAGSPQTPPSAEPVRDPEPPLQVAAELRPFSASIETETPEASPEVVQQPANKPEPLPGIWRASSAPAAPKVETPSPPKDLHLDEPVGSPRDAVAEEKPEAKPEPKPDPWRSDILPVRPLPGATPDPEPVREVPAKQTSWSVERVRPRTTIANRTIKRVEPWSILKFSLLFYAAFTLLGLLVVMILFYVASATGLVNNVETFIRAVGWPDFRIRAIQVFRATLLLGLVQLIMWTALNLVLAFLYNLVSQVVGGIEVVVSEDLV